MGREASRDAGSLGVAARILWRAYSPLIFFRPAYPGLRPELLCGRTFGAVKQSSPASGVSLAPVVADLGLFGEDLFEVGSLFEEDVAELLGLPEEDGLQAD